MTHSIRANYVFPMLALILALGVAVHAQKGGEDKKPSLSLKATPVAGFAPLRVRVNVDVRGGANDFAGLLLPEHRVGVGRRPAVRQFRGLLAV